MIDEKYLIEFKRSTNEDLLAAGLISSCVDVTDVKSILDIGAGTGLVSLALQRLTKGAEITVVDKSDIYTYPDDFKVVRSDWYDASINGTFDLVIFCHVLGDFPVSTRMQQVAIGADLLSENGLLVVLENGPETTFDMFVKDIFDHQGDEFNIDFGILEAELNKAGLAFTSFSFETFLPLGADMEEATRNANLFFPKLFEPSEKSYVQHFLERVKFGDRYALPVTQKLYIASRSEPHLYDVLQMLPSRSD